MHRWEDRWGFRQHEQTTEAATVTTTAQPIASEIPISSSTNKHEEITSNAPINQFSRDQLEPLQKGIESLESELLDQADPKAVIDLKNKAILAIQNLIPSALHHVDNLKKTLDKSDKTILEGFAKTKGVIESGFNKTSKVLSDHIDKVAKCVDENPEESKNVDFVGLTQKCAGPVENSLSDLTGQFVDAIKSHVGHMLGWAGLATGCVKNIFNPGSCIANIGKEGVNEILTHVNQLVDAAEKFEVQFENIANGLNDCLNNGIKEVESNLGEDSKLANCLSA